MIVKTLNSTYTLEDKGDGAFLMTSTNQSYPGPSLVQACAAPEAKLPMWLRFLDGPKQGRYLITSKVVEVTP